MSLDFLYTRRGYNKSGANLRDRLRQKRLAEMAELRTPEATKKSNELHARMRLAFRLAGNNTRLPAQLVAEWNRLDKECCR